MSDEKKEVNELKDDPDISQYGFCNLNLSSSQVSANELRLLMQKAEGEEKCILCRAIKELEQKGNHSDSSLWWIALMALIPAFGLNQNGSLFNTNNFLEILSNVLKANESELVEKEPTEITADMN